MAGAGVARIASANCVPCRANEFARARSPRIPISICIAGLIRGHRKSNEWIIEIHPTHGYSFYHQGKKREKKKIGTICLFTLVDRARASK